MVVTEHTLAMARAIPGAGLAIFPKMGHGLPIEDAARWNAMVLAFLTEAPAKTEAH